MKSLFTVLAVALIALPIFAEQKKPTVTPTPSGQGQRLHPDLMKGAARVVQLTVTPTPSGETIKAKGTIKLDKPILQRRGEIAVTPTGEPLEATTTKGSKSNSSERVDAVTHEGAGSARVLMQQGRVTGRVIGQSGKTFTVMSNGKKVTLSGAKLKDLPKVGEIVDITYTQSPGGPMEATTVKSSKSNSSE